MSRPDSTAPVNLDGDETLHGSASVPPEDDPSSIGRYHVVRKLGSGAMGTVYLAADPDLDRNVAIKVVTAGLSQPRRQARLLREAEALAKLSHPNVVTVHDVGSLGDGGGTRPVFIVMEFIEGQTLRQWLTFEHRSFAQIIDTVCRAGDGLVCAHSVGLVHRDFKPDNVLVSDAGAVKVVDFGLARPGSDSVGDPDTPGAETNSHGVTRTGSLMGTLAYMAPEQFSHQFDARADQFAFCVVLYEAVFGRRPFVGSSGAELSANILEAQLVFPPEVQTPRWLQDVLTRGLARDPAARFPSMEALLAAMRQGARTRATTHRVVGVLVVGGLLAAGAWVVAGEDRCGGGDTKLRAVWSAEHKEALRAAVGGSGTEFAADAARRAEAELDEYARAWIAVQRQACEAADVDAKLTDARSACIERRYRQFAGLVEMLSDPGSLMPQDAARGVSGLEPPSDCAKANAKGTEPRLPADPDLRVRIAELRVALDTMPAYQASGKLKEGGETACKMVELAREIGYGPVLADTLYWCGWLRATTGELEESRVMLVEAAWLAFESGVDRVAVDAFFALMYLDGLALANAPDAREWEKPLRALISRSETPTKLEAKLHRNLGNIAIIERDYALADHHLQIGRKLVLDSDGSEALLYAFENSIGALRLQQGRWTEALASLTAAREAAVRRFGEHHPELSALDSNLSIALLKIGEPERALATSRRAEELWRASVGTDAPDLASAVVNQGRQLAVLGRLDEARTKLLESLEIRARSAGGSNVSIAVAKLNVADTLLGAHFPEDASRVVSEAIAQLEASLGATDRRLADAYGLRARVLTEEGEHDAALADLKRAIDLAASSPDDYTPGDVGIWHVDACLVHAAKGDLRSANDACTAALAEAQRSDDDLFVEAWAYFAAAQLRLTEGSAEEAVALAEKARAKAPAASAPQLAKEIDAWLADPQPIEAEAREGP